MHVCVCTHMCVCVCVCVHLLKWIGLRKAEEWCLESKECQISLLRHTEDLKKKLPISLKA